MLKKRIITTFLILILLLSLLMLSSCFNKRKTYETEYFKYHIFEFQGEEIIAIDGLTIAGEQLKNIVIPEAIEGKRVISYEGYSTVPNAKKLIISYNVESINSWGFSEGTIFINGYSEGLKILYINCTYKKCTQIGDGYIATTTDEKYRKFVDLNCYHIANMQYLFNYENSQNEGVFFIDDLEINEQVEIIPDIPTRDGYTFIGWYSEPECINKIELEEYKKIDDEIVYLYAGWQ